MSAQTDPSELLVAEHTWLQRLARSLLRDPHAADDVTQDVSLAALRRRPDVGGSRTRMRRWLAEAARRVAQAKQRTRRERERRERRAAHPELVPDDGDDRLALHQRLLDAVSSLAEPYRATVIACYLEGVKPREVARRKGIPAATVRQHLSRALQQLRERLARDGGDDWRRALAPLAGVGLPGSGLTATLAWIIGMNVKTIAIAGALVACLALGTVYLAAPDARAERPPRTESNVATAPIEGTAATTEPPARTAAPASRVAMIRVVDDTGTPVPGAQVYAWANGEVHRDDTTREDGSVSFSDLEGSGGAMVHADGFQPVRRRLDDLAQEHEIVLGHGVEFTGTVSVDSRRPDPDEKIELELVPRFVDDDDLPPSLHSIFGNAQRTSMGQRVTVRPGERFRFRGLPADWSGTLRWPRQYLLQRDFHGVPAPARGALALDRIYTDARLELVRLPRIRGTVRWRDDSEPVASAILLASMSVSGGINVPFHAVSANQHGRFSIPISPGNDLDRTRFLDPATQPRPRYLRLDVEVRQPATERRVEFDEAALAAEEIVVWLDRPDERWCHFVVLTADNRPIQGVRLASTSSWVGPSRSEPTDEDGRSRLLVSAANTQEFIAGARGYRFERVRPPSQERSLDDPWIVRLQHGNRLSVRAVSATGTVPSPLHVVLRYAEGIFAGSETTSPTPLHRLLSRLRSPGALGGTSNGVVRRTYILPDDGEIEFFSLHPDRPFAVELRDRLDGLIVEREVRMPSIGTEELELEIDAPPTVLDVRVQSDTGEAVPAARITVSANRNGTTVKADHRGQAEFGPLFTALEAISLTVTAPGFARQTIDGLDGANLTVRLERALPLVVTVRDARGRVIEVRGVTATPVRGGEAERGARQHDGSYAFKQLPEAEVEVSCRIGGETFAQRGSNLEGRIEITVPEVGSFRARYENRDPDVHNSQIRLTPVPGTGAAAKPAYLLLKRDGGHLVGSTALLPGRYAVSIKDEPAGEISVVANEETVWPR